MAELKTKKNEASVTKFLDGVKDEKRRLDSYTILKLMKQITKAEPKMWGTSIIGFGSYHCKYASGREGDWFVTGFSPRKQSLTLYLMSGFSKYPDLLKKLGKFKTSKGCLYINKIEDTDIPTLKELIKQSVGYLKKHNK